MGPAHLIYSPGPLSTWWEPDVALICYLHQMKHLTERHRRRLHHLQAGPAPEAAAALLLLHPAAASGYRCCCCIRLHLAALLLALHPGRHRAPQRRCHKPRRAQLQEQLPGQQQRQVGTVRVYLA